MRFLPAIFMLLFSALGCGSERAPELAPAGETGPEDTEEACVPGGTVQAQPQTASQYVEMCEPELGVPPDFDCAAGVTLPITVDGVEVSEPVPNFACDAPSLQDGECFPGSTINRLPGQTRGGVEREEVVWVQFCRNEGSVEDDGEVSFIFTGAQMIGHNTETGATCFFELNVGPQSQWVGRDENLRAQGVLPSHDDPDFDKAFVPPGHVQCVQCHQNDPFVHHPWVDGARLPSDPSEPVLPILPADAPYYIVGGSDRDMRTIHIEGNACLSCHRVGMETDMLYRFNGFDANAFMPPDNPGSMAGDYQALLDCWESGPENTPGCQWRLPPGGGCDDRPAGDDHANAAPNFNFPREHFYGAGDDQEDEEGEEELSGACLEVFVCNEEECAPDFSAQCVSECTEDVEEEQREALVALYQCMRENECRTIENEGCIVSRCVEEVIEALELCAPEEEEEEEGEREEVSCCLSSEAVCEILPGYLCEELDGEGSVEEGCQDICPDFAELTEDQYPACCFGQECERLPPRQCLDENGAVSESFSCEEAQCQ